MYADKRELTAERLAAVHEHWRLRNLLTTILVLLLMALVVSGAVALVSARNLNAELAASGIEVPAEVVSRSSGRAAFFTPQGKKKVLVLPDGSVGGRRVAFKEQIQVTGLQAVTQAGLPSAQP